MVDSLFTPEPTPEWLVNQIAHALRNPIFAAQVQLEALALRSAEVPETRKPIETLQRQLGRLEETIGEMLLYGRPIRVTRAPVDVDRLLSTVAEAYRVGTRQEPAEVTVGTPGSGLTASWDPAVIRVILDRLLDNAVQHTSPPHPVELRVEPAGEDRVTLVVRDRGEGIPDDLRDRVLLPFFPQHRGRPGLGLAIAVKLTALLGGTLAIDSRPGQGTEVRLTLPLSAPSP